MANRTQADQEHLEIILEFVSAIDEYKRLSDLQQESGNANTELASLLEGARLRCRKARRLVKRWPANPASLN